jgi:hypothetical protein
VFTSYAIEYPARPRAPALPIARRRKDRDQRPVFRPESRVQLSVHREQRTRFPCRASRAEVTAQNSR